MFRKLKELFKTPEHWTQGAFARTSNQIPTYVSNPNATCWCLAGGVLKVSIHHKEYLSGLDTLQSLIPDKSIEKFNDNHSYSEVMDLIERAINVVSSKTADRVD